MAGIYIHIPFCKTRCLYCDFYTGTDESQKDDFVNAVCNEILLRKDELNEPVRTIYFGGGTPSRLHVQHFRQILDAVHQHFRVNDDAEITLEANPDDLSSEYIRKLRDLSFNRISIGIQSFDDKELRFLSRRHSARQAIEAVKNCQQAGFANISIDLMYGLPRQTLEIWKRNLQQAINLDIQHISAYHLIYEENTGMHRLLSAGKIIPVHEEVSTDMFALLIDTLTEHGFEHYEISNFAKKGAYSRHNTSYWKNEPYLGLGAAAHSFDGHSRSWNISDLSAYIQSINQGDVCFENEILSTRETYNEFIMTGLRTMWGIDIEQLQLRFGKKMEIYCLQNAQKYLDNGQLKIENRHLKLTRKGIFISDGIMSDLMWVS